MDGWTGEQVVCERRQGNRWTSSGSNGQVDELTGRRENKLYARGDRVTDEQVRGVTLQVDGLTSGQGNRLVARGDRVTDEQVR